MNKKIKSGSEIEKEIAVLFQNLKNVNELVDRIEIYLGKITGKELYDRTNIEVSIYFAFLSYEKKNNIKLVQNKRLINLLPFVKSLIIPNESKKKTSPKVIITKSPKLDSNMLTISVIDNCEALAPFVESCEQSFEVYLKLLESNNAFKKLHYFLKDNQDVADLLVGYIPDLKRNYLVELITKDLIPLSTIFVFFNFEKNVKENTEYFYKILKKKYSRQTIQSAIMRELENIKAFKFSANKY